MDTNVSTNVKRYTAFVNYIQPSHMELKNQYPIRLASDYKEVCFDPIEECKPVSKQSRVVTFECIENPMFGSENCSKGERPFQWLLARSFRVLMREKMRSLGLREALYVESLCFIKQHAKALPKGYTLVALGSVVSKDDSLSSPMLWRLPYERDRYPMLMVTDRAYCDTLFLAVRE